MEGSNGLRHSLSQWETWIYLMSLKPAAERPKEDKSKIDEVIGKGAKVREDEKEEKEEWTMITVRLPKRMVNDMNTEIKKRTGLSRNAWILEAFDEKLRNKNE